MKLTKSEYDEMIRKKPSLRPTEEQMHKVAKKFVKNFKKTFNKKPEQQFYEYNVVTGRYEPATRTVVHKFNNETQKYEPAPKEEREFVKSQNTHKTLVEGFKERLGGFGIPLSLEQEMAFKSPRTLVFTIPGQPVGKPRQTISDKWRKRPCVMRYRAWADKARASVPNGLNLGIYRQISFIAYLELPKSYSKAKRELLTGQPHMQKPDVDNILKGFDALFPEDKFIWKVSGEKRWDDGKGSRIEVELR